MKTLEKFIAWSVCASVSIFANGYVIMKIWGWFIVPVFQQPSLQFAESLGLMILTRFLTYSGVNKPAETKKTTDIIREQTLETVLKAGFILLISYIVSLFI
jgi:hypothetical protein